jgi:hypothetical protein
MRLRYIKRDGTAGQKIPVPVMLKTNDAAGSSGMKLNTWVGPELTHRTHPEVRQVGPELPHKWGRN